MVPRSNDVPFTVNGLVATATFTLACRSRASARTEGWPFHGRRNATLPAPLTVPAGRSPGLMRSAPRPPGTL